MHFLQNLFLLKYLPSLGTDASYGIIFLFGILTSFHCLAMCGGIAISQSVSSAEPKAENAQTKSQGWFAPSVKYNLGRVLSYTVVGAVVGGLGHLIRLTGVFKGVIPIIGGIFMIIMGIKLLGIFPLLRRFNIRMPTFVAKKLIGHNNYKPLYIGMLSGLMPCGPLQIIQIYALGTRSIIIGAVSMFIFAVGTVPTLFVFGALNSVINKKYTTKILKFSASLVVILGVIMIGRGLSLSGVSINIPFAMGNSGEKATITGNIQTVTTKITSDSFKQIIVQKDIPVKWTINANESDLNDCNNAMDIPKFKIEKKLVKGKNLVEFTPKESGEIPYSCWMGMIKSKIIVVDDIKK